MALLASALLSLLVVGTAVAPAIAHETGLVPGEYNWVDPPPDVDADGHAPTTKVATVALLPTGSPEISTATDDGQLTLGVAAGAIPAHGTDSGLSVTIEPLAPSTLAAAPAGLESDGNAYRVTVSYLPSKTDVAPVAKTGSIVLLTPHPAAELLFSRDGQSWRELEIEPTGRSDTIAARFSRSGYYLAASVSTTNTTTTGSTSSDGSSDTGLIVVVVITTALALGLVLAWLRRRRGRERSVQ
jgi:hypothetical protein